MYTGNNPTAIRSKEWFIHALLELLEEKSYDKINIKELCQKADLSRQTFYQLFDSKEEVMRCFIRKQFQPMMHPESSYTTNSLTKSLALYFSQNRYFIQMIYKNHLIHLFGDELSNLLTCIADQIDPDRDKKTRRIANAFLSGALTQAFFIWSQEENISEQEFLILIEQILSGNYYKHPMK